MTKFNKKPVGLTIVTVVDGNFCGMKQLYNDLQGILPYAVWIIKDSGHDKNISNFFEINTHENIEFYSGKDEGLYNALNFAISKVNTSHYLTVGSDDLINKDSLLLILDRNILADFPQSVISFPVIFAGKVKNISPYYPLSVSLRQKVVSHSVGCLIPIDLHDKFGYYDESFKILADSYLLTLAAIKGFSFVYIEDIVPGEFMLDGVSSTNLTLKAREAYRYQTMLGQSIIMQSFLYILRRTLIVCRSIKDHFQ
ncbi:hypothetical protein N9R76_01110 [Planktomarina temperata]|nr:hypothetical protein [Planktomarina temperata]